MPTAIRAAQLKVYQVRYRNFKRALVNQIKDKPCADCGIKYPPYVMDLDHLPGRTKYRPVAHMVMNNGTAAIVEEAAKCDVVCSNCHRIRTHKRSKSVADR